MTRETTARTLRVLPRSRALEQLPPDFEKLSGTGKINALLDLPDTGAFVRSLAPDSFYLLARDIGVEDCLDLLPMTTTEQRLAFIDLDAWRGSELDPVELDQWLTTLSIAGGIDLMVDTVSALDPELLVDYLLQHAVVVLDRTEEDEIEAYEKHYLHLRTPDNDFVIVLPPTEGDEVSRVRRMVEVLYRSGLKRARDLMFACKTGLRLENQELAYRFRTGRMADLGFPSREDSWALFAPVDKGALQAALEGEVEAVTPFGDEDTHLGLSLSRSMDSQSFLAQCLDGVTDTERFVREYAALVNKAVVATPGELLLRDIERITRIAAIARATVSLGLEVLAEGDLDKGREALGRVWLIQLHQLGHRATVARALRAKELQARGGTLFPGSLQTVLEHLRRVPRPQRTSEDGDPTAFASMAELLQTDAVLDRAEAMATSFETLFGITGVGFSSHEIPGLSEDDRGFVTYDTLANTVVAHTALRGEPTLAALSIADVQALRAKRETLAGAAEALSARIEGAGSILTDAAARLAVQLDQVSSPDDIGLLRSALLIAHADDGV